MPRFAAGFLQQFHLFYGHSSVDGFAHVVDGEQPYAYCGEGFHFDACASHGFCSDHEPYRRAPLLRSEFRCDPRQSQRMAEGDQVSRALCRLDRGHPGHPEDVAFFRRTLQDQAEGGRRHANGAASPRGAVRPRLAADIHHVGLAGLVEMAQLSFFMHALPLRKPERDSGIILSMRIRGICLLLIMLAQTAQAQSLPDLGDTSGELISPQTERRSARRQCSTSGAIPRTSTIPSLPITSMPSATA